MSRRKKSEIVRRRPRAELPGDRGSWSRWYVRVTNQPGKPGGRRPSTSAIPCSGRASQPDRASGSGKARAAAEVLREAARLAERVLRGRRVGLGAAWFGTRAQSPSAQTCSRPSTRSVSSRAHPPAFVERQRPSRRSWVRLHAGGPTSVSSGSARRSRGRRRGRRRSRASSRRRSRPRACSSCRA